MWLESSEEMGRVINTVMARAHVQVQDCSVFKHWADVPTDIMNGGRS